MLRCRLSALAAGTHARITAGTQRAVTASHEGHDWALLATWRKHSDADSLVGGRLSLCPFFASHTLTQNSLRSERGTERSYVLPIDQAQVSCLRKLRSDLGGGDRTLCACALSKVLSDEDQSAGRTVVTKRSCPSDVATYTIMGRGGAPRTILSLRTSRRVGRPTGQILWCRTASRRSIRLGLSFGRMDYSVLTDVT